MTVCFICKKEFKTYRSNNYLCSDECRKKYYKIYMKKWYINNIEKAIVYRKKQYKEKREEFLKQKKDYYVRVAKERQKIYNHEIKKQVFINYSNNNIKCIKCGNTDFDCLTIDHIHGGGRKEHIKYGTGTNFYKWLIKNNYPKGYQVLCMNCNFSKYFRKFFEDKKPSFSSQNTFDNKIKCFIYYSKNPPECNICGEKRMEVLSIDHINKTKNPKRSGSLYNWLIKNNYPEGYQVLCMNCNVKKEWCK